MLDEKQLRLIELLVSEDFTIIDALKEVQINRSTFYDWRKGISKPGKEFNKAYEEALQFKVNESRKNVQQGVNTHIKELKYIAANSPNHNARVNAIKQLFTYAELDPNFKQEITINSNDENKNALLEKWKNKQQDNKEDE